MVALHNKNFFQASKLKNKKVHFLMKLVKLLHRVLLCPINVTWVKISKQDISYGKLYFWYIFRFGKKNLKILIFSANFTRYITIFCKILTTVETKYQFSQKGPIGGFSFLLFWKAETLGFPPICITFVGNFFSPAI